VALIDALLAAHQAPPRPPLAGLPPPAPFPHPAQVVRGSVAAVSIGLLEGEVLLDLAYREDKDADVDLNLVMTGAGEFIEVQAGGEESTFRRDQLERLLDVGAQGIAAVTAKQREALGADWPLPPR
jgi:ribonuclease PH